MSKHPHLERHYTPGRFLAIAATVAVLAVVLMLMWASSVADEVPRPAPMTPATAGPAVEYQP